MKKLLIIIIIFCSYEGFTQAKDTLFVENGYVWYSSKYGSLIEGNKGSGVSPLSTDNAMVVGLSPNSNTVTSNVGSTVYVQSTGNNSTAQLAASATFTGAIESVLNYPQIIVSIRSGQAFSLVIEQFSDLAGTIVLPSITYTRLASEGFNQPITMSGSYYRVKVTNTGITTTTDLFIETWYGNITATPNLTNAGSLPVDIKTQSDYIIGQAGQTAVINNILPTTATANSTDAGGYNSGTTTIVSTGTGGTFTFEGSNDNITFEPLTVKRTTFGNEKGLAWLWVLKSVCPNVRPLKLQKFN